MVRIEIVAKRKCMPAMQPAKLGSPAVRRGSLHNGWLGGSRSVQCCRFHARTLVPHSTPAQCFVLWRPMPFSYSFAAMELRHLRYFVTTAEELNVSRASARLRISQPAVSRQLRDLEEELGVELFQRNKSGLKLTPAGETFLAHGRDLLRRSGDAVKEMAVFQKPARKKLTVGYIAPVLTSILTPALRRFAQQHPDMEV